MSSNNSCPPLASAEPLAALRRFQGSVGCFVLGQDFRSDAAAVVHGNALLLGPGPHLGTGGSAVRWCCTAPGGSGRALFSPGLDIRAKDRAQFAGMCGVQINIVGNPVHLETYGFFSFGAIQVIHKDSNQFGSHSKTLLRHNRRRAQAPRTYRPWCRPL